MSQEIGNGGKDEKKKEERKKRTKKTENSCEKEEVFRIFYSPTLVTAAGILFYVLYQQLLQHSMAYSIYILWYKIQESSIQEKRNNSNTVLFYLEAAKKERNC